MKKQTELEKISKQIADLEKHLKAVESRFEGMFDMLIKAVRSTPTATMRIPKLRLPGRRKNGSDDNAPQTK